MIYKIWSCLFFLCILCNQAFTQDKEIDKLEVFYDQDHIRKTLRRTNRLLDKPDYDYSSVPKLYKSMALFRLTEDQTYLKRNPEAFNDAVKYFEWFLREDVEGHAYSAHRDKILQIQAILAQRSLVLKNKGEQKEAQKIADIINRLFKDQMSLEEMAMKSTTEKKENPKEVEKQTTERDAVIDYAKKYLGVKYQYGGTTEKGFDCSGYTSFVTKKFNVFLPRTSGEQYEMAKKIKKNEVKKGDLVFFGSNKVSHVGIIISEYPDDLQMIHASTSVGISIVNVDKSSYWSPRIKGYGRVIND